MSRQRLPDRPVLDWRDDGTPVETGMNDIYFSVEDGLAETQETFLKACGLPERWAERSCFTIAELGFGTGLNFLAAWQLWRQTRPFPEARLNYVSFEGFPMRATEAERALARWPDLAPLATDLLRQWPVRARGIQRCHFPDGVVLTLHIDDIETSLAQSELQADAWFLDGFAPAKNDKMWHAARFPEIASRSAQGARLGTYTVAGAVRRGLSDAGFDVAKVPGHGRKRERLEADVRDPPTQVADPYALRPVYGVQSPKSVAIIGGGIAGACLACSALDRGATVDIYERSETLAAGASGNPLALVMPRLDAADTPAARALIAAYLYARQLYAGRPGVIRTDVLQRPRDASDRARFNKLRADPPLDEDLLAFEGDALVHLSGLILSPRELIQSLIKGARLIPSTEPVVDFKARRVADQAYDVVCVANGMGVSSYPELGWLPLEPRLGQVDYQAAEVAAPHAVAAGDYALAANGIKLWGATFEAANSPKPATSAKASEQNAGAVRSLMGEGW
ncbi:MAG: tRNA (5-methylaminomethyl-2-thiouridine)(34)-methyltransferase MnmD, partial [Pseudomonadota bacterium]